MATKETLKQGGYQYIKFLGNGEHLLKEAETGKLEIWFSNLNHASYGLKYKNTHLEFARDYKSRVCELCDEVVNKVNKNGHCAECVSSNRIEKRKVRNFGQF